MKELNEEQLRKIIDGTASGKELASFDENIESEVVQEPTHQFSDTVISKYSKLKVKTVNSTLPPFYAGVFFLLLIVLYSIMSPSGGGYEIPFELDKLISSLSLDMSILMKGLIFVNIIVALLILDKILISKLYKKSY